jgi:hypothetical protein
LRSVISEDGISGGLPMSMIRPRLGNLRLQTLDTAERPDVTAIGKPL